MTIVTIVASIGNRQSVFLVGAVAAADAKKSSSIN
jgi:hypothetical protein